MKNIVLNYYKSKLYKGRSKLARIFDYIMLRAIFFCASYLWYLTQVENKFLCTALSITATLMLSIATFIFNKIRLDKSIIKEQRNLSIKLLNEQLMCAPREELVKIAKNIAADKAGFDNKSSTLVFEGESCYIYVFQSPVPINQDHLFKAYLYTLNNGFKHLVVLSTSNITSDALSLVNRLGHLKVHTITSSDLYAYAQSNGLLSSTEAIEEYIIAQAEIKKTKRRNLNEKPLSVFRIRKYIIAAAVIWAASYFTGYSLYYRVLSGVSLCLAAVSFWFDGIRNKSKLEA